MKKLLLINLVIALVMLIGCANTENCSKLQINNEAINEIYRGGGEIVGSVEEYSYLSEKGKILPVIFLKMYECIKNRFFLNEKSHVKRK